LDFWIVLSRFTNKGRIEIYFSATISRPPEPGERPTDGSDEGKLQAARVLSTNNGFILFSERCSLAACCAGGDSLQEVASTQQATGSNEASHRVGPRVDF